MYLYPRNISMFHGRTVNTEILKTNITNKGQLITTVNEVPRESPHSAVKSWLNTWMFEINITFGFKEKECVYSVFWGHIFKFFMVIMRARKLLPLKNEDWLSYQQLILEDAALRKEKQTHTKEPLYWESSNKPIASGSCKCVIQDYSRRNKHLLAGTDTLKGWYGDRPTIQKREGSP